MTTCKFGQSQNFLNDSSLTTGKKLSKNSASTTGEKRRVPSSVLGAALAPDQAESTDKLLVRIWPLVAWHPSFPSGKGHLLQWDYLNVPPDHHISTAQCVTTWSGLITNHLYYLNILKWIHMNEPLFAFARVLLPVTHCCSDDTWKSLRLW